MKRLLPIPVILLSASMATAETPRFTAVLSARAAVAEGETSWLEGGFGALEFATDDAKRQFDHIEQVQVGAQWHATTWLSVRGHAVARADRFDTRRGGIVELFADVHHEWSRDALRLRAGHFFLPTSRENVETLWTSPYSSSFSAFNTWIGQEIRPVGVDLQWTRDVTSSASVSIGATAFRGNDSAGALLAWRGWSSGNRLSSYGEVVPLPALFSLNDPAMFSDQRDDGTKPLGRDLDGRTGSALRVRVSIPDTAMMQVSHVDNRGDRRLHRGEYAWDTSFTVLAFEWNVTPAWILIAEAASGKTGMGPQTAPAYVDASFRTGYLLLSRQSGRHRLTGRAEFLQLEDRDGSVAERNDHDGRVLTLAWLFDLTERLQLVSEVTDFRSTNAMAAESGFLNNDARAATVDLRFYVGE